MVVFSAYIDDGGATSEEFITLAAYVARASNWERFSRAWEKMLSDYAVDYIHLIDIMNFSCRHYAHLDRNQRSEMMNRAVKIITSSVAIGIVTVISVRDYLAFTDSKYRNRQGSAYCTAAGSMVSTILDWLSPKARTGKGKKPHIINFYIEDGHKNTGEVILMLQDLKDRIRQNVSMAASRSDVLFVRDPTFPTWPVCIGDIEPGTKSGPKAKLPLQAADILSYGYTRRFSGKAGDDITETALRMIVKKSTTMVGVLSGEILRGVISATKSHANAEDEHRLGAGQMGHVLSKMGIEVKKDGYHFHFNIPENWVPPWENNEEES